MKTTRYILLSLLAALTLASCDKDGDTITVGGASDMVLIGSGDAVLSKDNTSALALTLNWTDNARLATSDARVQAPIGAARNVLQFATDADFLAPFEQLTATGSTSMQFTAKQLNAIAGRLGLESDVATPIYVRLKSSLANNIDPSYSNTLSMRLTPYFLDMSYASVLNSDQSDSEKTLYSRDNDGVYSGFIGASAWWNWWLQEADGTLWGNLGEDGKAFYASSEDSHWNFWYPGQAGCYYTTVNTTTQTWEALLVTSLSVSGDLTGDMTYDRKTNKWTLTCNAAEAGNATVRISGAGKLYNESTGTDDDAVFNLTVGFFEEGGSLVFNVPDPESDLSVDVPAAGQVTLTLDLNDPTNWTLTCTEGGGEGPVEIPQQLYILGHDDTWEHDQWLTLYDEDNLCYAGLVNFHSSWGYYFTQTAEDWANINQDPESEDMKLAITSDNANNIQQPGTGLYVTIASLGWMSYWYPMTDDSGSPVPVTSVACAGFNNDWNLTTMTATETPGVYTCSVTATGDTPWGVQVVLNGSWIYYFGTYTDGTLRWGKQENGNPKGWEAGNTYTFTVDLGHGTYTLTE